MKSHRLAKFKTNKLFLASVIAIVFIFGLIIGYSLDRYFGSYYFEQGLVTSVIDGDTIEIDNGMHVRYLGIDTPEVGEPYSDFATSINRQLVEGKKVELQRGNRNKDEYGRLLRYVYIDGTFVNAELVAQGYAKAYIFDAEERYSQLLVQLEQYAKLKNKGMWAK